MPQIEIKDGHRVDIIESESHWGSKVVVLILHFDTEAKARKYVDDYNKKYNPPGPTPDWYMIAQYVGKVL